MKRAVTVVLVLALSAMLLTGLAGCGEASTDEKVPLHFIQFFDPDCPFCKQMEPTIAKLQSKYEPKIYKFEIIDVSTD